MKIVIAPDKMKGSLSAKQFCEAAAEGVMEAIPGAKVIQLPMSDGGDGFIDIVNQYIDYEWQSCIAHDPLMRKIESSYLLSKDNKKAFLEMARISGLELLGTNERNCLITSSFGLGEIIKHAIEQGATHISVGLGGSATNDGGAGMASALGYRFLDKTGELIFPSGQSLQKIEYIDQSGVMASVFHTDFVFYTDVMNPLIGPKGAVMVYARQKGAQEDELAMLEEGMIHFSALLNQSFGDDLTMFKGVGAAGGLGAGAISLLKARIEQGAPYIIQLSKFEEQIRDADLIITGEGKLDKQSKYGKIPYEVARLAKKYQIPVHIIAGSYDKIDPGGKYFKKIHTIIEKAPSIKVAKNKAFIYVKNIAYEIAFNLKGKDGKAKSV